jgi:glycosyltransferase involved in cell wall biosynthesis
MGDKLFTKYFLKPVDAFLVMSEAVLNDTKTFNVDKPIALSPHPLFDNFGESISKTEARQKLNLPTNCDYLLFFGLIRKYKGLDLLLKAFADSRFRNRNLKLIIAGEYYADKEYYTNLIKQLQLENEIIQTDAFITDSEVKYYFCASNLVVQPYISATQSGVTQIAYHFNKPMIVTNVGGLAEMCPNDKVGYVVNPNPDEIAGAILKFFDENKENTFIENIIEEKKKYTWEILMDNLLNLHENIK